MEKTDDSFVDEIEGYLGSFEKHLPRQLDPVALSRAKLPFSPVAYRETLSWRVTELGRAAMDGFNQRRLAAALLLTRGAVETSAALWYLSEKIANAVKTGELADLRNLLMRLSHGTRNWEETPGAVNVLTFVDTVDRKVEGFRRQYDCLSEVAHPNYSGTTGLFSRNDPDNFMVYFGSDVRNTEATRRIGLVNLSVALMLFEHTYNSLSEVMPGFVALCEKSLPS